jgi:hypothetical protein
MDTLLEQHSEQPLEPFHGDGTLHVCQLTQLGETENPKTGTVLISQAQAPCHCLALKA